VLTPVARTWIMQLSTMLHKRVTAVMHHRAFQLLRKSFMRVYNRSRSDSKCGVRIISCDRVTKLGM